MSFEVQAVCAALVPTEQSLFTTAAMFVLDQRFQHRHQLTRTLTQTQTPPPPQEPPPSPQAPPPQLLACATSRKPSFGQHAAFPASAANTCLPVSVPRLLGRGQSKEGGGDDSDVGCCRSKRASQDGGSSNEERTVQRRRSCRLADPDPLQTGLNTPSWWATERRGSKAVCWWSIATVR